MNPGLDKAGLIEGCASRTLTMHEYGGNSSVSVIFSLRFWRVPVKYEMFLHRKWCAMRTLPRLVIAPLLIYLYARQSSFLLHLNMMEMIRMEIHRMKRSEK